LISAKPVNAEPNSCKISAITAQEKEAVDILQEMYYLQKDIKIKGEKLNELNAKKSLDYDPHDADSVNKYNNLANEFNSIVEENNSLSNKYNQLKDIFNTITVVISPSKNIVFITCLNSEMLGVEINTTSLNIDSLNTNTETMKNDTNILIKNTEAMNSNIENLIEESEAREVHTEGFKSNVENLENSTESLNSNSGEFRLNIENLEYYKDYKIYDQLNNN
jgi:uncharacterized protein YoxC